MTLTAAFATLHQLTGDDDLVIGVASTHRTGTAMRGLVGLCVNTLPVRVDTSGDPSFAQLLHRVRDALLEAQRHGYLPFDLVLERLGTRARGTDGAGLVRVTPHASGGTRPVRPARTGRCRGAGHRPGTTPTCWPRAAADPDTPLSELAGPGTHPAPAGDDPGHPAARALRAHPQVADADVHERDEERPVAYAVLRDQVARGVVVELGLLAVRVGGGAHLPLATTAPGGRLVVGEGPGPAAGTAGGDGGGVAPPRHRNRWSSRRRLRWCCWDIRRRRSSATVRVLVRGLAGSCR
ncbi:condensation domain-containing protein [Streptomyces dangxiongensis]